MFSTFATACKIDRPIVKAQSNATNPVLRQAQRPKYQCLRNFCNRNANVRL